MNASHLTPLRRGQQFYLAQAASGSLDRTNKGVIRLDKPPRTQADSPTIISTEAPLVVESAHWTLDPIGFGAPSMYQVQAFQPTTSVQVWLDQLVDQATWLEREANRNSHHTQASQGALMLAGIQWPEPCVQALRWAVYAIYEEHTTAGGMTMDHRNILESLSEPLEPSDLDQARAILTEWGIPNPAQALRERGFVA